MVYVILHTLFVLFGDWCSQWVHPAIDLSETYNRNICSGRCVNIKLCCIYLPCLWQHLAAYLRGRNLPEIWQGAAFSLQKISKEFKYKIRNIFWVK